MYMCVRVWIYTLCTCVYKPEIDVGYLLQSLTFLFLRRGLSLNLELVNLVRMAGQWGPGTCLFCLQNAWVRNTCHYTHFFFSVQILDIQTQVLTLMQRHMSPDESLRLLLNTLNVSCPNWNGIYHAPWSSKTVSKAKNVNILYYYIFNMWD